MKSYRDEYELAIKILELVEEEEKTKKINRCFVRRFYELINDGWIEVRPEQSPGRDMGYGESSDVR